MTMETTFVVLTTLSILLTLIHVGCFAGFADPSFRNTSSADVVSVSQTSTMAVASAAAILVTPITCNIQTKIDKSAQPRDESHTEAADWMSSKATKVTSEPSNTCEKCSRNQSRTTLPGTFFVDSTSQNTSSAAVTPASQTSIPAVTSAAALLLTPTTTLAKIDKTAQDECTDNPTGSYGNLFIWKIVVALSAFLYFMPRWLMYSISLLLLKLLWDIKNLIIVNSD